MYERLKKGFLSGNQLKLIALAAMTIDHIGAYLIPDMIIFRIIGRIAFPIFAYMLAEGCRYTRNRMKYMLVLGTAAFIMTAGFAVIGVWQQRVLTTFLMSAALCFALDRLLKKRDFLSFLIFVLGVGAAYVLAVILPIASGKWHFSIDYGFFGVLFPVAVFAVEKKRDKLIAATLMCVLLSNVYAYVQWYSLIAIPLLALYNGKRGNIRMKYFYYLYFPAHLFVILCLRVLFF